MRALSPVQSGFVDRDGVAIHYEVYGEGEPTVYLLMPNTIVESRGWKAQVPFLARSFRVVVSDPRGNGGSDTPDSSDGYADRLLIDDAWAVLDAVDADRAVLVGLCSGAGYVVIMAAEDPDRVLGICAINPGLELSPPLPHKVAFDFDAPRDSYEGWQKLNSQHWLQDWPDFARFFFGEMFPEPHSTKQREDGVGWAMQTSPEAMILARCSAPYPGNEPDTVAAARALRCPVLVISGSLDRCQNPMRSLRLAELTGAEHVIIDGGGHLPQARDPVKVNLMLRDFVRRVAGR
ncbi:MULTISPECIES: alpha/beta hydrolase [unclassified Microbacterium]|uniref:alpha/beta fold hydrolase n=1 Tax=unclassified Microbacterium TaxID=2609290 RepID=UPI00214C215E|nr:MULTISPECIES: alpha/beta hydrolase [unclassified Microbacterium]MCR2808178.1 alpha/beta hydrolase [Microbacterium sp. zg.B185]WIM19357.1 alpha/beta hydrolase [Microbacterium sp. zg-B185]